MATYYAVFYRTTTSKEIFKVEIDNPGPDREIINEQCEEAAGKLIGVEDPFYMEPTENNMEFDYCYTQNPDGSYAHVDDPDSHDLRTHETNPEF